jgi:biopolymer transport protein ExbD
MAQLQPQPTDKNKKRRYYSTSLRIDMTPLVDLGFLLITFFITTTTMAESKAMQLDVPADGALTPSPESATITVLLGKDNKTYIYSGQWKDAAKNNNIIQSNYNVVTGLGSHLRAKQLWLQAHKEKGQYGLIYIIKPTDNSSFQNVVDALDEATINKISRYAVAPLTDEEKDYMKDK